MNRRFVWRSLMCLAVVLAMLTGGAALAEGQLSGPQVQVENTQVTQGDFFTIEVAEVPNAYDYDLHVIDTHGSENDEEWTWYDDVAYDHRPDAGTLSVSTAALEPGEYMWWCGVAGNGGGNMTTGAFTVTAQNIPVALYVSTDNAITSQEYRLAVCAPGATEVTIYRVYPDGEDAEKWETFEGIYGVVNETNSSAQELRYAATAKIDGAETKWEDCQITVNVTAPYGNLTGTLFTPPALEVLAGTDVVINVNEIENAESYGFYFGTTDGEDSLFAERNGQFTLTGLIPGEVYTATAWAQAAGYNQLFQAQETIMVARENGVQIDAQESALTIRLDKTTIDAFSQDSFTLYCPGAANVQYEIYRLDGEERYRENGEEFYFPGKCVYNALNFETPGQYELLASAFVQDDSLEEGGYWTDFEDCKVTLTVADRLPAPTLSILNSPVERGEMMEVTVGAVEGADRYRVQIMDDDGNVIRGSYSYTPGLIKVVTAPIEAGTYTVHAYAEKNGVMGYTNFENTVTITPTTITDKTVVLRVGAAEAPRGQAVPMSIYAPGAYSVRFLCEELPDLDWGEWNGDSWGYSITFGLPGTYHISAEAYGPDGSKAVSDVFEFTVVSNGTMPVPSMEAPAKAIAGQDLTIPYEFDTTDAADDVDIIYGWALYSAWEWEDNNAENEIMYSESIGSSGSFTIPGRKLNPFERYYVQLYAYTTVPGYEAKELSAQFVAVDSNATEATLTAHDGQSEITVSPNENVRLEIDPAGATAIHLYLGRNEGGDNGDGWSYWGELDGITLEELEGDDRLNWSQWNPGDYVLYLEVNYGDFTRPDTVNYYSEPLTIHVEDTLGRMNPPEFTVPDGTLPVGQVVALDLTYVDPEAQGTQAHIHGLNDDGSINLEVLGYGDISSDRTKLYLSTARMEPNKRYLITVWSWADGRQTSVDTLRWFTATGDATETDPFYVSTQNVQTNEAFIAAANVPGAKELRVYLDGNKDAQWTSRGEDGFVETNYQFGDGQENLGDHTLTLAARFVDEWESWDDWTDIKTVTVHLSADNGEMPAPSSSVPDKATLGDTITLSFGETENAVGYSYWIHRWDNWNWLAGEGRSDAGNLYIDTSALGSGVFWVETDVHGVGYTNGHKALHLAVLDREADQIIQEDGPYFSISTDSVETKDQVHIIYYVPGADGVRLYHRGGNDDQIVEDVNGPGLDVWHGWDYPEDVDLYVSAHFTNEEEETEYWTEPEYMATIHVGAHQVYSEADLRASIPDLIVAGDGLNLYPMNLFPNPEQVGMWANVFDRTDGRNDHIYAMNTGWGDYILRDVDNPEAQDEDGWEHYPAESLKCIEIPAEYLKTDHVYDLDIGFWTDEHGVVYEGTSVQILVIGEYKQDVRLTVNGSAENQTFQLHESYLVAVDAPGACAVRVLNGNWWDYRTTDEYGHAEYNWQNGDPNPRTLYAEACYDGIDFSEVDWGNWDWNSINWSGIGNTVTVTATPGVDEITQPQVQVLNSPVARGGFLEVKVSGVDSEAHYHASPLRYDEDHHEQWAFDEWYDMDSQNIIRIPTANLDEGEWYLRVDAYDKIGWYNNSNEVEFSVDGSASSGIVVQFSKNTVETHEQYEEFIRVPGAVQLLQTIDEPENWNHLDLDGLWIDGFYNGEEYAGRGPGFDQPGTYTLRLYAWYEDSEAWEYTNVENTITVTGDVYTRFDLRAMVPATLNAGEDLLVPIRADIDPDHVWANLFDQTLGYDGEDGYHPQVYSFNWDKGGLGRAWFLDTDTDIREEAFGGDLCIQVPAQYLKPGHTYSLDFGFDGQGLSVENANRVFITVAAQQSNITLTMDGTDNDRVTPINKGMLLNVNAPEDATAILIVSSDGGWEVRQGHVLYEDWSSGEPNTVTYYARYTTDSINFDEDEWWRREFNWSGISNAIQVTYTKAGEMPRPDVELVSDHVTRGDFLQVRLLNGQAYADYKDDPDFYLNVAPFFRGEGEYHQYDKWYNWDKESNIILVPTADLDGRDERYDLDVNVGLNNGYEGNGTQLYFYVTEPETDPETPNVFFNVSKDHVNTRENVTINIYAPGADGLRLYENGVVVGMYEPGTYMDAYERSWGDAGDYVLQAAARINGKWVFSEERTLTVDAPYGNLTTVTANVDTTVSPDSGIVITFGGDFDWVNMNVYRSDGFRVWHSWGDGRTRSVTVPAVDDGNYRHRERLFDVGSQILEGGESYVVELWFQKEGYTNQSMRLSVLVTEGQAANPDITVKINGNASAVTVDRNEHVSLNVTAPSNATAILVFDDGEWRWYDGYSVNIDEWRGWGDGEERVVYARYTADAIQGGDRDWNHYNWSAVSNAVKVKVVAYGTTADPDIALSADSVLYGQDISFTVRNAADFDGFNWRVYNTEDNRYEMDWQDWQGEATHSFDTFFDIDEDTKYLLFVSSYGKDKLNGSEARKEFTVSRPGERADSPTYTIENENATVARGDFLRVRVNGISQATAYDYRLWVYDDNIPGSNYGDYGRGDPGVIYVPTGHLESGEYRMHVYARAKGYLNGESEQDLSFTVDGSGAGGLYIVDTDVKTFQTLQIGTYAKGADQVMIYVTDNLDEVKSTDDRYEWQRGDGDNRYVDWRWIDNPDTYYFYLVGQFGNAEEGNDWLDWVGEPVTVTVTSDYDSPMPRVDYTPVLLSGEDCEFTVYPDPGVEYHVHIERFDYWDKDDSILPFVDGEDPWENWTEAHTFRVSADQFHEGSYAIRLWWRVNSMGYTAPYEELAFHVKEESLDSNINLTLSANELLVNEEIHADIYAQGADKVQLWNEYGLVYENDGESLYWENGAPTDNSPFYFARALIDGQWYVSRAQRVNWIEYAQCEQVPLTVDSQVERGELLNITLGETDHATVMHLHIMEKNSGDEVYFKDYYAPGDYQVPTAYFAVGEYRAYVSNGGPGYGWVDNGEEKYELFTVEENNAVLSLSANQVEVGERMTISVFDPDAERIRVTNGYWWMDEDGWEGDSWYSEGMEWGNAPDEVTIRAEGMHNGEWQLIGEASVSIINSKGNMPEPDVDIREEYAAGEDIYFHVVVPEYARNYEWQLRTQENPDENILFDWDITESGKEFRIPADVLQPGTEYVLNVLVRGYGYRCYEGGYSFTVSEAYDEGVHIEVDGSMEDRTLPVNQQYLVTVHAGNATAFRMYDGEYWHYFKGNSLRRDFQEALNVDLTLYVQAYYGEYDEEQYDRDESYRENLAWDTENQSNVIHISFTGDLAPQPQFTMRNPVLYAGTDLVLYLYNMDENQDYAGHVWKEENGEPVWYNEQGYTYQPEGNTINIGTGYLEPGVYKVRVDAYNRVGYQDNCTDQTFVVVDSSRILRLPAFLTEIEAEAFKGINAQVVIVPGTVTNIASGAFANSSVVAAVVPDGVNVAVDAFPEGTVITNQEP